MAEAGDQWAWMELHDANGRVVVQAMASSQEPANLRYELSAQTIAGPNQSQIRQAGEARLAGGVPQPLARLTLGQGPAQRYRVALRLFDGERVAAEESLVLP
jgi:hypothetical protein